jgi:hypothetical protein
MEAEALARLQPNVPNSRTLAFRDQLLADATIGIFALALELGGDLGRPGCLRRLDRLLVQHGHGHGIPP